MSVDNTCQLDAAIRSSEEEVSVDPDPACEESVREAGRRDRQSFGAQESTLGPPLRTGDLTDLGNAEAAHVIGGCRCSRQHTSPSVRHDEEVHERGLQLAPEVQSQGIARPAVMGERA